MDMQANGSSSIICGHRGGGGDLRNREILTRGTDWSTLAHEPDHYDYRDRWANRLPTFARMLEQGVRCFELDLLPSRDGDVMMVHNSVIDGKNVWEYSTEELEELGCTRIERLFDLVENFRERTEEKVTLLLELKGSLSSEAATDAGENGVMEQSAGMVRKMVGHIRERTGPEHGWDYDQLPLIGFNHGMLKMAKGLDSHIRIGLSYAKEHFRTDDEGMRQATAHSGFEQDFVQKMIREAREAEAFAILPDDRLVVGINGNQPADGRLAEAAHEDGLKILTWTDRTMSERPEAMLHAGVDTLISDRPLATRAAQEALFPPTAIGRLQRAAAQEPSHGR